MDFQMLLSGLGLHRLKLHYCILHLHISSEAVLLHGIKALMASLKQDVSRNVNS